MQIPTLAPLKPAKVYPVDTQAVLRMLEFDKIGYDSIFSINTGPPVIDQPAIKHVTVKDFILPVLLLIMLGYVTWLRYVFAKELSENITVIVNSNLGQQIYRDREFSANIFKLLTFFNFACSAGIFIFLLARYYEVPLPFDVAFYNIILCIGGVGVLYLIKGLSYRILGSTFKISNALQFFRFNALVIYHLLGIGMLPFIILAAFADPPVSDWAIAGTLILIGIALLIRFVKGFTALRLTGRFHFVYFLLYICALEIAPLLIAIKVFLNWA
ncbi:MAG: DUF4271 domain-containing protein [Bacteroidetes bacterium]|nr:DUF4271 domain-containing protein [Bacteroidota bacterium]